MSSQANVNVTGGNNVNVTVNVGQPGRDAYKASGSRTPKAITAITTAAPSGSDSSDSGSDFGSEELDDDALDELLAELREGLEEDQLVVPPEDYEVLHLKQVSTFAVST